MRLFPAGSSLLVTIVSLRFVFANPFPTDLDTIAVGRASSSLSPPNSPPDSLSPLSPRARPAAVFKPRWQLQLGSGWTFEYTSTPEFFVPVDAAALQLHHLYNLVEETVQKSKSSSAGVFRLGQIGLVFKGVVGNKQTDLTKAALPWPVIIAFCNAMREETERGHVVKYEGMLNSESGQQVTVQLDLLPGLLNSYIQDVQSPGFKSKP